MSCVGRVFSGCGFVLAPRPKSFSSPAAIVEIKKKAKSGRGLFKPTLVSPTLRSFLDVSESSHADAIKQIWAHIKLHNLRNPLIRGRSYVTINSRVYLKGKRK